MFKSEAVQAIAKFGSPYGVYGQLKVYPFTVSSKSFLAFPTWFSEQGKEFIFSEISLHQNHLIVKLLEADSPEQAKKFTNQIIYVYQKDFPPLPDGEYYWFQLIGCKVITKTQLFLGRVKQILPTGSNDVLVLNGGKRHLIPYLQEVVISVDLKEKSILVDWETNY